MAEPAKVPATPFSVVGKPAEVCRSQDRLGNRALRVPTNAKQSLADRFEKKTADGMVDVKFYLKGGDEATTDEVFGDVNALYEAFERGDCRPLSFGDRISN